MTQQALAQTAQVAPKSQTGGRILQRKCDCGTHTPGGGECESCADKNRTLQRRARPTGSGAGAADGAMPASGAGGRPLAGPVAARYRPGLGSLVDRVRIHDDATGNAFATQQRAVAVTEGTDIYFAANAFAPHSETGRNLLAHELAHVWQQHSVTGPPSGYQSSPGDRYEQEADRMADSHAFTHPPAWRNAPARIYQRRTAAEQIATEIRRAVEGWGTDEQAIFNALSGRTPQEIKDIEAAYVALSGGETLEARLRDELSGDDLARAMSLLQGATPESEAARRIYNAVEGWGTDEEAIYAVVAGRTQEQWQAIQIAYKQIANEDLMTRLQDEFTEGEFAHFKTLLPGAKGGAATDEDRATVAANQIQSAFSHWRTDTSAIFSALTGRTDAELQEIAKRFQLLTGEEMDAKLRSKLSDSDYSRVQLIMHPNATPEAVAAELKRAMDKWIVDKDAIWAILTGRPAADLVSIRLAYQKLDNRSLEDRFKKELSSDDLKRALQLLKAGVLDPEDEIHTAIAGLGTDEERLFAVIEQYRGKPADIQKLIDAYAAKGYGDMLADIRGDLSGKDLKRAMEILHGTATTTGCSASQRAEGLEAISGAVSLAQNAVRVLNADISAGKLSKDVSKALTTNFNGGNAPGAVNIGLATQVRDKLANTRDDLLTRDKVTCTTPIPMPCGTTDDCLNNAASSSSIVLAWTCNPPGTVVRLCDEFFGADQATTMLHEFVHHTAVGGVFNVHDTAYHDLATYSGLTPLGTCAATDSLCNADSYAQFAKAVS